MNRIMQALKDGKQVRHISGGYSERTSWAWTEIDGKEIDDSTIYAEYLKVESMREVGIKQWNDEHYSIGPSMITELFLVE